MSVHNMWDERFAAPGWTYGTDPNEFLAREAHRIRARGVVVSIGEGEGRNAVFLALRGHRVVAIDGSSVGLAKAQQLARERGVAIETIAGDLDAVAFDENVDAIVNVFCHLPAIVRRRVHRRAQAALVEGGIALVELYRPEQLRFATGGPKDLDMLSTLGDLRDDFDRCDLVLGEERECEVIEGRLHTGRAAVVDAVFMRRPD